MNKQIPLSQSSVSAAHVTHPLVRWLWLSAGLLQVGLGSLGIVLPVLPTTVFFIGAAACFTRSSPRLERWVLALPHLASARSYATIALDLVCPGVPNISRLGPSSWRLRSVASRFHRGSRGQPPMGLRYSPCCISCCGCRLGNGCWPSECLPVALTISFVGFMESFAVAKSIAAKERGEIDANQELVVLGLANLGGALLSGYPVTGGFSRSTISYQAGARRLPPSSPPF
jgi:hypothetical protein